MRRWAEIMLQPCLLICSPPPSSQQLQGAWLFEGGCGLVVDPKQAVGLWRLAELQSNGTALFRLAGCMERGEGGLREV